MTATITDYDESQFPGGLDLDDSLLSVLEAWEQSGLAGTHPTNPGGFFGGTAFSGTSYAFNDSSLGYSFEVEAASGSTLNYDFGTHTLYGSIAQITIGAGLDTSGNVTTPIFEFTFDAALTGTLAQGRTNDVHDTIWGLMNGSVTGATDSIGTISTGGLVDRLVDGGIDVNDSVADIVGASFASESELLLAA